LGKTLSKQHKTNQLRIIAGKWRGRKLNFPNVEHLRPTPDRVRETIFNWLQSVIGNARCIDLFSGSGALGFESLSRGADHVTMIEKDTKAVAQLQENVRLLSAIDITQVVRDTAQNFIASCNQEFDIVYLDPPYQADLWAEIAMLIQQHALLAKGGYVYLECSSNKGLPVLPPEWQLLKDKTAGDVRYCLFQNEG
jgi:16S rRNA (guanine966-N2)-methyltransferase